MAGRGVSARVGVESVADPAGVAGAQGTSDLAVGGDFALRDFANELVDFIKEVHRLKACQTKICGLRYYFGLSTKHLPASRRVL